MSGCGTHGGQLWYRHFPADFLDGGKALSAEERGCYITVLDLIYQFGGKIADRAQWIAGQCNVSVKRWNMIRRRFIECGKLLAIDGVLTNPRATEEISQTSARSEARAEAGRAGGRKSGASRRNARKDSHDPSDNSDLAEAGLRSEAQEIVSNDLADYVPDNRPEESSDSEEYQSLSGSRNSRSSRVHISLSTTESVPRERDEDFTKASFAENVIPIPKAFFDARKHPANAPALTAFDRRVTFDANGRAEVNGSSLEGVVSSVTEAAQAPYAYYPIANCTPLIDLLCEGYDPDVDIIPVISRLAKNGHRAKHMNYYATAVRRETRPSWKPIGTWGQSAEVHA